MESLKSIKIHLRNLYLVVVIGLFFICSLSLSAQEATTQQPREVDEKIEEISIEGVEILQEISDFIHLYPPISVSGKIGLRLIDENINLPVNPEVFHFETEEISAAINIEVREKGSGLLAGTDTSAEFKVKVSNLVSESPMVYSDFGPNWFDNGSNLKISGIGGFLDLSAYPFKASATTLKEPVKVENSGFKVDIRLGDFTLNTVTGSSTEKNSVLYSFSSNFSYSATEGTGFQGGVVLAQDEPVGNLQSSSLKTGYGGEVKMGSDKEGFGATVSVGVKAFPINDPNAPDATTAVTIPPSGLTGVKVDAPLTYKLGELTVRGGFSFTQYQWYEENLPKKDERVGHELRINLGETLDTPENGLKSHVDLYIIFPHYKEIGNFTTVDPGDKVDDVYGERGGERREVTAQVVFRIISKLNAKISDILTITPILTLTHDPNYSDTFRDIRTMVGYEVRMEAEF